MDKYDGARAAEVGAPAAEWHAASIEKFPRFRLKIDSISAVVALKTPLIASLQRARPRTLAGLDADEASLMAQVTVSFSEYYKIFT